MRIHREKLVEDLFGAQSEEHPDSLLNAAMKRIETLGGGVLIYLRTGLSGCRWRFESQSREDERRSQWLEVGVGAQILRDLGLTKIRLIAGRSVDYVGVEGFGLTLVDTEML